MYLSLTLASIGVGGTRYTLAAFGADQFTKQRDHGVFFNWFICAMYIGTLGSLVGTIYIEDNVSWGLGFGLCVAANLIGLVVLVSGKPYYRLVKQKGSPFTRLACVLVASFRKRKVLLSSKSEDYCREPVDRGLELVGSTPTNSFKFLNHAALVTQGDTNSDGCIKKPWKLCTLEQVEDLKSLIRILPIWSTGIALHIPVVAQTNLLVLQALSMDRHMGPHFQIPAGTMLVFVIITTAISLALIDRFLIPTFQKLTGTTASLLKRIGVGHILTISSMGISAIVESRRLATARTHNLHGNSVVPMSTFWIVPQLVVVGVGEAFMFPGQVSLFYQEFPKSLKSTAAAILSLLLGIAFYLATAVIDVLKNTTGWLPDGINDGRMDNVYWVLAILGLINFGYFLVCSWLYKYHNTENQELASIDPC
ncbi:NRT1/ PTR family 2.7-like protein [Tanacetum coccineum]